MIVAPKDLKANLAFRREVLKLANDNEDLQRELWIRCARDIVFWLDCFGFTYSPKDVSESPTRPFITWDFQEVALRRLCDAIGKHDVLIEKSRDMGASWMCLSVFVHSWLFKPMQSFLMVSRKEEYVDAGPGDPKSLFFKAAYLIDHLPEWMIPEYNRKLLHLANLENGSSIDGESTNSDVATGDRRTAILLDEFAKVETGSTVLPATQHATKCRIFNSTPEGSYGAYYETRQQMYLEYPDRVIRLHWSEHPDRKVGLYTSDGPLTDRKLVVLDKNYVFPKDYRFILDGKLRSPYYDEECRRSPNQTKIAQELDIDYVGSAYGWFDPLVIKAIAARDSRPPVSIGILTYDEEAYVKDWIDDLESGDLQLWVDLDPKTNSPYPGRYAIGCDISMGTDSMVSSNSVASVGDLETRKKIAQLTTRSLQPWKFARYVVALCRWFHDAFLIWETNGPGKQFSAEIRELGYMNLFMRDSDTSYMRKVGVQPGWHSDLDKKRTLLAEYQKALMEGDFENPCREAIEECLQFIQEPNGCVQHSRSKKITDVDPNVSGDNHGDCVIADALLNKVFRMNTLAKPKEQELILPVGSFGYRMKQAQKLEKLKKFY